MTDAATPEPEPSALLTQLRQQLAAVDGMPLITPVYAKSRELFPRIDRAEAKEQVLAEWVAYLLQRVESLEARIPK